MSTAQADTAIVGRPHSLQQANPRPTFGYRAGLGIKGSRVYLQTKGSVLKPSRIPRPLHTADQHPPPAHQHEVTSNPPISASVAVQTAPDPPPISEAGDTQPVASQHEEKEGKGERAEYSALMEDESNRRGVRMRGSVVVRTESQRSAVMEEESVRQRSTAGVGREARRESAMLRSERGVMRGARSGLGQGRTVASAVSHGREAKKRRVEEGGKRVRNGSTKQDQTRTRGGKRGRVVKQLLSRGGRPSEKRSRHIYLARKYCTLWARKVFGRVLPTVGRRHYTLRLKKKVFRVWNEQWWSSRREWKLNIRAECHNRYRLWLKVWSGWTKYLHSRRQWKRVHTAAAIHDGRRLKKMVWRCWAGYIRVRRNKKALREQATQWGRATALRSAWMAWRRSLLCKREGDIMACTALHYWALKLQRQVWARWVWGYQVRLVLRQKGALAVCHWSLRLAGRCWQAWLAYTEHRRRKKHMRGMAADLHCSTLTTKHFTRWHTRLLQARQLAQFEELVREKGAQAVKRRALTHWRHYMEVEHYHQHQVEVATWHYQTTLKSKAVASLKRYLKSQQLQAANKSAGHRFHIQKVLQHAWAVWLRRCEHREEIKMLPLTRKAREHFKAHSLGKVFPAWKAFIRWRRHRRAQAALADAHFKSIALPKCFAALQHNVAVRCYKKELQERAQSFRRETLLSMGFYKWWRAFHFSQNMRMLERVAVLHSEEVVKKTALEVWRVRTRKTVQQLTREQSALLYHRRKILSAVLERWKTRRQSRVLARQHSMSAWQHASHKMMRSAWAAWVKYVLKRRQSHERCAHANSHYQRVLLAHILKAWKVYHCHAKIKTEKKTQAYQLYSLKLKSPLVTTRHMLGQWQESVQLWKLQHEMEQGAIVHFEKKTILKCFEVWRQRTLVSLQATQRESEQVQEATKQLSRAKQVRVLACWREHTNSSVARRIGKERAVVHANRALLRRCFAAWHSHHSLSLRKMLLSRQREHFERNRLLSTFYAKWRLEFMGAVVVKQKSTVALWQWSQTLQRKALMSWLLYTINRKRKAERYAEALQRHRSRLLHIGVTQWIKFASSMQSQRMESALRHQTQTAVRIMQCVRRYVHRWRAVAREKKRACHHPLRPAVGATPPHSDPAQSVAGSVVGGAWRQTHDDIWSNIAKKLQIPDGPTHRRPQPKHPDYLRPTGRGGSWLLCDSDPAPRPVVPQPPSPPVLYSQQRQREMERDGVTATHSFTFLPSTCSEQSVDLQADITERQTLSPRLPVHAPRASHPPTVDTVPSCPVAVSEAKQLPVLLPPSAFEKPREGGKALPAGAMLQGHATGASVAVRDKIHSPQTVREGRITASSRGAAVSGVSITADLHSPAVRSQIVHMRDELKKFHELKTKQRTLEEQIAQAEESGDQPPPSELQAKLRRTIETLRRHEPVIMDMVSHVHELLSRKS